MTRVAVLAGLCVLLTAADVRAQTWMVGTAKVDITPPAFDAA